MKKLNLLLAICILTVLLSCNSDDELVSEIAGTWNLVALDYFSNTTTTATDGTMDSSNTVGVGRDLFFTNIFNESPNEVFVDGSFLIDLTTTAANGDITNTSIGTSGEYVSSWTLSGDRLSTTWPTGTQIYTIIQLDSNSLIYASNDTTQTNVNGNMFTTIIEEKFTFSR